MVNKPKAIGTSAESAVVRVLRAHGFPHAERRALAGVHDLGDITGCPGICWEVKGGEAAKNASDAQIAAWMVETDVEVANASAHVGVLVVQRRGVGPANAHRWWAVVRADAWILNAPGAFPVRMVLGDACLMLRAIGYGEPLPEAVAAR